MSKIEELLSQLENRSVIIRNRIDPDGSWKDWVVELCKDETVDGALAKNWVVVCANDLDRAIEKAIEAAPDKNRSRIRARGAVPVDAL